jgi:multidrug efflux pump
MTSLAFGFGVLPLALASGAGAGAQKAIGTAVVGGVVTSTFLVTLFAPLFYVLIERSLGRHGRRRATARRSTPAHPETR